MAAIALSLWLALAFADDRAALADYLGDAAAELSNGNARGFLKRFDPQMPGYAQLEAEIYGLVKIAEVASSAQILEFQTTDEGVSLQVDWFVELRPHGQNLANERRRDLLQVRLKRVGKGWKIQSLSPLTIFLAPTL